MAKAAAPRSRTKPVATRIEEPAVVAPAIIEVATPPSQDHRAAQAIVNGGRLRDTLLELWQRTRIDWGFVTDRLSSTFRKEKWIGGHDRRFISETLYGMIRNLRRIDLAISMAAKRKTAPRDLERLAAYLVLEQLISPDDARRLEPSIDWVNVRDVDRVIANERKMAVRIALAASLPDWLAARLVADWGDEAEPLAMALNTRAPMTVRSNLLVGDRSSLAAELSRIGLATTAGNWCDTSLTIESRTNLFATEAFIKGAMEAQDEGSQLLADLAVPRDANGVMKAGIVVDLCAGAGGKTLAVAARMNNRGRVVSSDIDGNKLEELRRRARRGGVSTAQAAATDGEFWPSPVEAVRGKADVVLVDAPCSGVGALRRNPEARFRLRESDISEFAAKQRKIIDRAFELCAHDGVVVYATCTVLREENQGVVASILSKPRGLRAVPLSSHAPQISATFDRDGAFMAVPHRHNTDGFFAQVISRGSSALAPVK
jgi:16S rRNA (cytosine967-C5)-methyltransferase